jgi:hypothetical protein
VAWADNAGDPAVGDAADATTAEQDAALAALGIVNDSCDPTLTLCTAVTTVTNTLGGLLP